MSWEIESDERGEGEQKIRREDQRINREGNGKK